MFDDYVYKNLKKYGNTVISHDELVRYGESKIKKDLLEHGYSCTIRTLGYDRVTKVYPELNFNERTVIIEVIK